MFDDSITLSDVPLSRPVRAHEQLVVQVVDGVGKSKFSLLCLAPTTKWSDLLISIVNRVVVAQQWCVANAITCGIRSVDPSTKCDPSGPTSLGNLTAESDFCFMRFFTQKVLSVPMRTKAFKALGSTFTGRAPELLEEAFQKVDNSVDWLSRFAPGFKTLSSPTLQDLSDGTASQLLASSLPVLARGQIRHLILKFHPAVTSPTAFNRSEALNTVAGRFRLVNWFQLYDQATHNPERSHPVSIRAKNIDTVKLIASDASVDSWADRGAFEHSFLVCLAALCRDTFGTPPRLWIFELDFISAWIDTRLKFFLAAKKSKIMRELVQAGTGTLFEHVTQRGVIMLRETLLEETLFVASLLSDLADLDGPSGPTTFMDFCGRPPSLVTLPEVVLEVTQVPSLPLRELELWSAHFLTNHSVVRESFRAGVRHISSRAIDKALAVIELKNGFAIFAQLTRKTRDFDMGTLSHPQSVHPPRSVLPPSLVTISESSVKFVVTGHMVEEDLSMDETSRVLDLAVNPLSRLSQQLQDAHVNLSEQELHPENPAFFEAAAEIRLLKANLQRLLTKCILQTNADELAKRRSPGAMSQAVPNTWFFEDAWDSLRWAQVSTHTLEANASWRLSLSNRLRIREVIGPSGFNLLLRSSLGQLLRASCSREPFFEEMVADFEQSVVRLCLAFVVRERFSPEESQMILFPRMLPVFWVPEIIEDSKPRDLFDPSLLMDSQGSFRQKILHVHIVVKPEFMGTVSTPEFVAIFQGCLGFEEEDMKLDNRELKFFEIPNRFNALLALGLFESDDNLLFYKRSLLLRILSTEGSFKDELWYVDSRGRRVPLRLDFKSRASLAARLLKKRNIHLCLSFDSAEGAAQIFQANEMVATGLAFGKEAVSFSMLVPAPVSSWNVKMMAESQVQSGSFPYLGCNWTDLKALRRRAETVYPRFVSLIVFSHRHDRCFEAKIPLTMNNMVQNAWGWSDLSFSGLVTNAEADALPTVSRIRPRLPHRRRIRELTHPYSGLDLRVAEITSSDIKEALLTEDPLNESRGFPSIPTGELHPRSFLALCLEPSRQGVPFLIREGEPYSFDSELTDRVRDGDRDFFFLPSIGPRGLPRRSIFAHLGVAFGSTTHETSGAPCDFYKSGSALVGLWVQMLGVLQDLEHDVIPVSAAFQTSRILGIAPDCRESVVSVDWDKARDATASALAAVGPRTLATLFDTLDTTPRVLLHMVFFYHHLSRVPVSTLQLPLALSRHKWSRLPRSPTKRRSYFVSKFLTSCVETAVKINLVSNQAVVTCPFPKMPASLDELEALTVMAHDLTAVNTKLRLDDIDYFHLQPTLLGDNSVVPFFLMADEVHFIIHTSTTLSGPQHMLMELKLPFAEMLCPPAPRQHLEAMVSVRR